MSKTYMRKESGDDQTIKCIALSDWARYRQSGYVFVEKDEDGNTPEQQFVAQSSGGVLAKAEDDGGGDDVPTMENKKDEIVAYLVANDIEHDEGWTKAELLDLIE